MTPSKRLSAVLLFAFYAAPCFVAAGEPFSPPNPIVKEEVELVSLIFRLMGDPIYSYQDVKEYSESLKNRFEEFRSHPVVEYAKEMRSEHGVSYDAVMSAATRLAIRDGHVALRDDMMDGNPAHGINERWNRERFEKFQKLLDDFYQKTRFHEFFESQKSLYEKIQQNAVEVTKNLDYVWFDAFFGAGRRDRFNIILNMQCGPCNFSSTVVLRDGVKEVNAVIGVYGRSSNDSMASVIVHEFTHSFSNPLVERHWVELKASMERYRPVYHEVKIHNAYDSAQTLQYEMMVRAVVLRYFIVHGKEDRDIKKMINDENTEGFLWVADLADWLGDYEADREKYASLDDFMPEIVRRENALITDDYVAEILRKREEARPKIVRFEPANRATDVDPSITELIVIFDRPMRPRVSWCKKDDTYPKGPRPYPDHVKAWSDDLTTNKVFVVLEPNKTYNVYLNPPWAQAFRSAEGVPLKEVHYTFTTGDAR